MAESQQKVTINISRELNAQQRIRFSELAIEKIQTRTRSGLDIEGVRFQQYSASYKDSIDFDIAGKTGTVNLEQTGDMLDSIELLGHGTGFVVLGYEAGTLANDKAAWAAASDNGASRRFLGLSEDDRAAIENTVKADSLDNNVRGLLNNFNTTPDATTTETFAQFLRRLGGQ